MNFISESFGIHKWGEIGGGFNGSLAVDILRELFLDLRALVVGEIFR